MAIFWTRAVLLLVFVIAVLQVIHMTLLSRLEAKRNERRKRVKTSTEELIGEYNDLEVEDDRKRMHQMVKQTSVLDSSGEYHIINFLIRAKSLGSRNHIRHDISLVSQSSVSQLYNLGFLSYRWHGLTSIAVFALNKDIPLAIETILLLRRCHSSIRQNTSFHLVYPLSVPKPAIGATTLSPRLSIDVISKERNCDRIESSLKSVQSNQVNYGHSGVAYPNNLLRNVARRNSLTEYSFVVDVDLVPNHRLYEHFFEFAKQNGLFSEQQKKDKVVYVVPAYEVNTTRILDKTDLNLETMNQLIPKDKKELLKMIDLTNARPFYVELCWKCQKYTDYENWQKNSLSDKFGILFEVLWRDPWEPFYISSNTVPFYDERFRQYGFNRISQVCELHISGYKFSVLNNAFVIHKGFKSSDSFHKEKDLEQERNRSLFRQFKTQLKDKYPESSRRCY